MTDRIIQEIESEDVYADLMLASTTKMFLKHLRKNETLRKSLVNLLSDQSSIDTILNRVDSLLTQEYDERYSNPLDYVLSAYLYVIGNSNHPAGRVLLHNIAMLDREDLWWSKFIASHILETHPSNREVLTDSIFIDSNSIFSYPKEDLRFKAENRSAEELTCFF